MKHIELATMSRLETAAGQGDAWWKSLSKRQQQEYIKKHPKSKYAGSANGKDTGLEKPKAKPKKKKKTSWLGKIFPGSTKKLKTDKKVKKAKSKPSKKAGKIKPGAIEKFIKKTGQAVKKDLLKRVGKTFRMPGLEKKAKDPKPVKPRKPPVVTKYEESNRDLEERRKNLRNMISKRGRMKTKHKKSLNVEERKKLMEAMKALTKDIGALRLDISKRAKQVLVLKEKALPFYDKQKQPEPNVVKKTKMKTLKPKKGLGTKVRKVK